MTDVVVVVVVDGDGAIYARAGKRGREGNLPPGSGFHFDEAPALAEVGWIKVDGVWSPPILTAHPGDAIEEASLRQMAAAYSREIQEEMASRRIEAAKANQDPSADVVAYYRHLHRVLAARNALKVSGGDPADSSNWPQG